MTSSPPAFTRAPAQAVRGFCMGATHLVPGVSGGTVAIVFGIYEALVAVVKDVASAGADLLRLRLGSGFARLAKVDWAFVVPLLAGIAVGVVALREVVDRLIAEEPVRMAAALTGVVAASIVVAWHHVGRRDAARLVVVVATAVVTFVVLGARPGTGGAPALWLVAIAGAVVASAMLVPGVSTSSLLLVLGVHADVAGAVGERDVFVVGAFVAGAVTGLAVSSSLLDWALRAHRDTAMAVLTGLMAGSLRVLWPWPAGTGNTSLAAPPAGEWMTPLAAGVLAAVAVLGVAGLGATSGRSRPPAEA